MKLSFGVLAAFAHGFVCFLLFQHSAEMKDFLSLMLIYEARGRASAETLIRHTFLDDADDWNSLQDHFEPVLQFEP